jgi:cytochrome P450
MPDTELYNPMIAPHKDDPFPYFRWARDHEPVAFHPVLGAYLVTRYETVRAVAADPELFSSHHSLPLHLEMQPPEVASVLAEVGDATAVLIEADGAEHTELRAVWHRMLHGTRINRLRPRIAELAFTLVAEFADRGRADLVAEFAHPLVRSVIGELLGIPPADRDDVYERATDGLLWANPLAPLADRVAAAHRYVEAQDYFRELLDRCRAEPKDDIVSMLATVDDLPGTPFSLSDFTSIIRQCYGAGVDTTRDTITSTVLSMLSEGLWPKAVADRGIISDAIEETLRRDAAHRGMLRTTTQDVELDGVALPAGSRLLLLFGSANRDERRFTDPDSFDLTRQDARDHVAFGHGPHACVGAHLARSEARLAVEVLTRRLPELALARDYEPSYVGNFFFHGLERLDVTWA